MRRCWSEIEARGVELLANGQQQEEWHVVCISTSRSSDGVFSLGSQTDDIDP